MTVFKKKTIFILLSTLLVTIIATILLATPQSENPIYESSLFLYRTSAASENPPIIPRITYLNDNGFGNSPYDNYVCYKDMKPKVEPATVQPSLCVACISYDGTCNNEETCNQEITCNQEATCQGYTCTGTCFEDTCYQVTCNWYTCSEGTTCGGDDGDTCDGDQTEYVTCYGYTCHYTCNGGNTCDGTQGCDGTDTNDQEPTCDGKPTCDGTGTCNAGYTCAGYHNCVQTQDGAGNCITSSGTTCNSGITCDWTCGYTCVQTCSGWTACGGTCGGVTCESTCGFTCGEDCNGHTMQSTCFHTCRYTCGQTCLGYTCSPTCQSTCDGEGCGDPECDECEDPEGIIYLKVNEEYEFESPCPDGGTTTWEAPGGEPDSGQGSSFSTKFPTPGDKTVTVEWEEDDCSDDAEFQVIVSETDKWTVMIYICADDNESEGEFITCFKSMAAAGSNEEVNFVAQMDRYSGDDTSYGDWTDVRRGLINKSDVPSDGTDGNRAWGVSIGEQDMADPGTLVNFVNWGTNTYPAEHYALFFLGHGSGWWGGFWDFYPNYDCLETREFRDALEQINADIELVAMDSCYMNTLEVAYEIREYSDVFVASQDEQYGWWLYLPIFHSLRTDPDMDCYEFGEMIVKETFCDDPFYNWIIPSAIDLSKIDTVVNAVSNLASTIMNTADNNDYLDLRTIYDLSKKYPTNESSHWEQNPVDLGDFLWMIKVLQLCNQEITNAAINAFNAYEDSIIWRMGCYDDCNYEHAFTGLDIELQKYGEPPLGYYDDSLMFVKNTQWDEFLQWWEHGP